MGKRRRLAGNGEEEGEIGEERGRRGTSCKEVKKEWKEGRKEEKRK